MGTFSPAQCDMCRLLVKPIPGSLHPSGLCQRGSNMVEAFLMLGLRFGDSSELGCRDMLFRSIISYLNCLRVPSIRYRVLVWKNLKSGGTFDTCSSLKIRSMMLLHCFETSLVSFPKCYLHARFHVIQIQDYPCLLESHHHR